MPHNASSDLLQIGEMARRAGVSVPTVRFYDDRGLIQSTRTSGNKRLFARHELRRLAVIAAGQRVGLTLEEIRTALDQLPPDRAPSRREWRQLGEQWAVMVARRLDELAVLQSSLDSCIGCGCLSLGSCTLLNPSDEAASEGPGSRWLRDAREAGQRE
jgi:MerR family redox-sensitive transcriptional activator SoxR